MARIGTGVVAASLLACAGDSGSDSEASSASEASSSASEASSSSGDGGALDYCPGVDEVAGTPCRVADDCDAENGEECGPQGAAGICGGAGGCVLPWVFEGNECPPMGECADIDGAPAVCRTGVDPCCGDVSACVARCTDTSCAADERCEANGLCAPIPCDDGYACADGARCSPGAGGSDVHGCEVIPCDEAGALECPLVHECIDGGCVRSTCDVDADCSCGNCIAGQCWEKPWFCYTAPA